MAQAINGRAQLRALIVALVFLSLTAVNAGLPGSVLAQDADLNSMSLEDLMTLEVTSVSKKQQSLKSAAAAIYVISKEDIRRSTARSIPELLRVVPGLHVARIDSSRWAISARGNNGLFANKLLVLMDGRSVYTPLFSGVYWEAVDTNVDDIERIEVIRGPGAALWGANAVNGVINIITKKSSDTQGAMVVAGGGSEERGFGSVRYGAALGADSTFRLFSTYRNVDDSHNPLGGEGYDSNELGTGGFRIDGKSETVDYTLHGDITTGSDRIEAKRGMLTPPYAELARRDSLFTGGNVLGRAVEHFDDKSELSVQFYYDQQHRADLFLKQEITTYDLDTQYRFNPFEGHDVTAGFSSRIVSDDLQSRSVVTLSPDSRTTNTIGAYFQDDVRTSDQTTLTFGTKFEHNEYTGSEWQPNIRFIWEPDDKQAVWASVSRAVRTPSRADNDIDLIGAVFPGDPPISVELFGNRGIHSERLMAYEVGYRVEPLPEVTVDLAAFYNYYSTVYTNENGQPFVRTDPVPHVVAPLYPDTLGSLDNVGGEILMTWKPVDWIKLQAWYAYIHSQAGVDSSSTDLEYDSTSDENTKNQAALRIGLNLPRGFETDAFLRYVDSVQSFDVPAYFELDLRIGWRYSDSLEFSLVGNNLLDSAHVEYQANQINLVRSEIERGVYAFLKWQF